MKEKIKTWILVLLVLGSLVESYYLIYRLPGSDSAVLSKNLYVKTDNMGPEERVENLLYPDKMIIHFGDDRHTLFYPSSTFYNLILTRLQGRGFESFQRRPVGEFNWQEIRSQNPGIELSYDSGIPVTLLQRGMQLSADPLFEGESIDRIWIYTLKNEAKVHALFFSTRGDIVYEAAKVDLTVQDVQQHVDFGSNLTAYTTVNGEYYIPEAPLPLMKASMPFANYRIDQMQSSLFFDAGSTRYIQEKDGSEIYTDSKRSLQFDQEHSWMSYSDPSALAASESTPDRDVLEAVEFVNQHGGWEGSYRLVMGDEQNNQVRNIVFRQYYGSFPYGSYPVFDQGPVHYGAIHMMLQQGSVSSYERSLMYMNENEAEREVTELPGGDDLRARLQQLELPSPIVDLTPAYMPQLDEERLHMNPVWKVTLRDGTVLTLNE